MKFSRYLPNFISIARLLFLPFIVQALIRGRFLEALVLFSIGSLTDLVDGLLARWLNAVTPFGRVLDPLADKIDGNKKGGNSKKGKPRNDEGDNELCPRNVHVFSIYFYGDVSVFTFLFIHMG